jgi:hypothetical protein
MAEPPPPLPELKDYKPSSRLQSKRPRLNSALIGPDIGMINNESILPVEGVPPPILPNMGLVIPLPIRGS